jgi:hypothetical protein
MHHYLSRDDYIDQIKDFLDNARRKVSEARQYAILTREYTITVRDLTEQIAEGQRLKFPPGEAKTAPSGCCFGLVHP